MLMMPFRSHASQVSMKSTHNLITNNLLPIGTDDIPLYQVQKLKLYSFNFSLRVIFLAISQLSLHSHILNDNHFVRSIIVVVAFIERAWP